MDAKLKIDKIIKKDLEEAYRKSRENV